jgi:hypothetical protein
MSNVQFPEDILQLISNDFLITFKTKLEKTFENQLAELKDKQVTYWNFYQWLDSTCGFYRALKESCDIHNCNEIIDYLKSLEWYDSDPLDSRLTQMLYERGLIIEGSPDDAY